MARTHFIVSAMSKLIVILVLMVHTMLYVCLPQPEDAIPISCINQMNSYDDYFVEKVLHIPDKTPAKESDDIERIAQSVEVEEFYTKLSYKELNPTCLIFKQVFPRLVVANISLLPLDVLSPPPKPLMV